MDMMNFLKENSIVFLGAFLGVLIIMSVGMINSGTFSGFGQTDISGKAYNFESGEQVTISNFLTGLKTDPSGYKIVLPDSATNHLISEAASFASEFGITESIFYSEVKESDKYLIYLDDNIDAYLQAFPFTDLTLEFLENGLSGIYLDSNEDGNVLYIVTLSEQDQITVLYDLRNNGRTSSYDAQHVFWMGGYVVSRIFDLNNDIDEYNFNYEFPTFFNEYGEIYFLDPISVSGSRATTGKGLSDIVTITDENITIDTFQQTVSNPGFNVPVRVTFYNREIPEGSQDGLNFYDDDGSLMDVNVLSFSPLSIEADYFNTYNCTDNDYDGYAPEGENCGLLDCDDTNSAINPSKTEICNGIDDDCDDSTRDVDLEFSESCGLGICVGGTRMKTCDGSSLSPWGECSTAGLALSEEICDNGLDDDCNGEVDDGDKCHVCYGGSAPIDSSGDGYLEINDCCDLWLIEDLSANYKLTTNIDCSDTINWDNGRGFEPIGDGKTTSESTSNPITPGGFKGIFNGNAKSIRNLYINRPNEDNVGLFSGVGTAGQIKSLDLVNVNITGRSRTGSLIGAAVGMSMHVSKCSATGNVKGHAETGGLVGRYGSRGFGGSVADITETFTNVNVYGNSGTGGIIGKGYYAASVYRCYSRGDVTGTGTGTGGIIGGGSVAVSFSIRQSYSTGDIKGIVKGHEGKDVGGLAGGVNNMDISDSFSTGSVTGGYGTGALAGRGSSSSNNYFNNHPGNPDTCLYSSNSGCIAIDNDENYFKQKNKPISDWYSFNSIWFISPSSNNGYPSLRWFTR